MFWILSEMLGTLGIEKETGGVLTSCNQFVTFVMV